MATSITTVTTQAIQDKIAVGESISADLAKQLSERAIIQKAETGKGELPEWLFRDIVDCANEGYRSIQLLEKLTVSAILYLEQIGYEVSAEPMGNGETIFLIRW